MNIVLSPPDEGVGSMKELLQCVDGRLPSAQAQPTPGSDYRGTHSRVRRTNTASPTAARLFT